MLSIVKYTRQRRSIMLGVVGYALLDQHKLEHKLKDKDWWLEILPQDGILPDKPLGHKFVAYIQT